MKKGFTPILILVLVLVAIVAIAAYLIGTQDRQFSLPISVSTSTPIATTDPTANWKTYQNTKLNYTIKYPPTWQVDSSKADLPKDQVLRIFQNGYELTISWPSAFGPGGCIFSDQPEYKTFNQDPKPQFSLCEGEYKEFKSGIGIHRRLVKPSTNTQKAIWPVYTQEKTSSYFVTVPPIGYSAPLNYSESEITMMDQILSTYQVVSSTPSSSPSATPTY